MSHWYWAAIVCAALLVITALMPAYITDQGGGVWWWQIDRGWNNVDEHGDPRHDDLGNRIRPNWVRTGALYGFGVAGAGCVVAGYLSKKKRPRVKS
jgi:hypothetical protein